MRTTDTGAHSGPRVIEIGCGPGAAAREVARRVGPGGRVLAVDRSPRAILQLVSSAGDLINAGMLSIRTVACVDLVLAPDEQRYDLAFAVRVGDLDGRHPAAGARALAEAEARRRPLSGEEKARPRTPP